MVCGKGHKVIAHVDGTHVDTLHAWSRVGTVGTPLDARIVVRNPVILLTADEEFHRNAQCVVRLGVGIGQTGDPFVGSLAQAVQLHAIDSLTKGRSFLILGAVRKSLWHHHHCGGS